MNYPQQQYIPSPAQRQKSSLQNLNIGPSEHVIQIRPAYPQGYPGLESNIDAPPSSSPYNFQPSLDKIGTNSDDIPKDQKAGFLRKVYGLIFTMLAISTLVATPAVINDGYRDWLKDHSVMLVVWFLLFIGCLVGLFCTHKQVPINYIFAFGIAFSMGMYVSHFVALFDPAVVITALLLTAGMTLVITCHALFTKRPNQGCLCMLLVIIISALFMMLIMMFIAPFSGLIAMYCTIYAVLYGVYLWIDTWLIANEGVHDTDSYMLAALFVYIDIVLIFLYILMALGSKSN